VNSAARVHSISEMVIMFCEEISVIVDIDTLIGVALILNPIWVHQWHDFVRLEMKRGKC
jgi:hypothetical protein